MTPTEELNKWIAEFGSERDALNVALARLSLPPYAEVARLAVELMEAKARICADAKKLATAQASLEPLQAQHDAYFNIESGERIRLVQRANTAEARAARLEETLQFYGDESSYENDTVDIGVGEMPIPLSSRVDIDGGQIARAALSASGAQISQKE